MTASRPKYGPGSGQFASIRRMTSGSYSSRKASMSPAFHASKEARTISTFSCDIARPVSRYRVRPERAGQQWGFQDARSARGATATASLIANWERELLKVDEAGRHAGGMSPQAVVRSLPGG